MMDGKRACAAHNDCSKQLHAQKLTNKTTQSTINWYLCVFVVFFVHSNSMQKGMHQTNDEKYIEYCFFD